MPIGGSGGRKRPCHATPERHHSVPPLLLLAHQAFSLACEREGEALEQSAHRAFEVERSQIRADTAIKLERAAPEMGRLRAKAQFLRARASLRANNIRTRAEEECAPQRLACRREAAEKEARIRREIDAQVARGDIGRMSPGELAEETEKACSRGTQHLFYELEQRLGPVLRPAREQAAALRAAAEDEARAVLEEDWPADKIRLEAGLLEQAAHARMRAALAPLLDALRAQRALAIAPAEQSVAASSAGWLQCAGPVELRCGSDDEPCAHDLGTCRRLFRPRGRRIRRKVTWVGLEDTGAGVGACFCDARSDLCPDCLPSERHACERCGLLLCAICDARHRPACEHVRTCMCLSCARLTPEQVLLAPRLAWCASSTHKSYTPSC